MADFIKEPAFEIGSRIEIRGHYSWFVVLKPASVVESALENFLAELSSVLGQQVRVVRCGAVTLEKLRANLNEPGGDPVLIPDLDQVEAGHWSTLDINRSGFSRTGPILLWLSSVGLTGLCEYAPNLRSFIGGSIFYLGQSGEAMTEEERKQRIADLESHFRTTSAEVVHRAELGTLPTEPHFVEWLVLLDRGDLV